MRRAQDGPCLPRPKLVLEKSSVDRLVDVVGSVQLTRKSVKQHDVVWLNNRIMNAVLDAASTVEREVSEIAAALARWYADHAPIRRRGHDCGAELA